MPILIFLFWILMNGRITWEIVAFGAVITALVTWFAVKVIGYSVKKEWRTFWKKSAPSGAAAPAEARYASIPASAADAENSTARR